MDYLEFERQSNREHSSFRPPDDCAEQVGPVLEYSSYFCWTFRWSLIFTDGKYIRIWEHYSKVARLSTSHRSRFALHYGPLSGREADGEPKYAATDPVEIRIDNINNPSHLHWQAPEPHYFQDRIRGLDLGSVDRHFFVKAILNHRRSGKPIDKLLGFRIE